MYDCLFTPLDPAPYPEAPLLTVPYWCLSLMPAAATVSAATKTRIQEAIQELSPERLRALLQELSDEFPDVEHKLAAELTYKRAGRVRKRVEVCGHCDEEYDAAAEREDDECIYHPGLLAPSFDHWACVLIPQYLHVILRPS